MAVDLSATESAVREELDAKYAAREATLKRCRPIIRGSANAIRALHRNEVEVAREYLAEVKQLIAEAEVALEGHPDIRAAGFYWDATKEYAEAELTAALLAGEALPMPSDLGLEAVPYLKGLGEAVGEQRRRLLDQLRKGDTLTGPTAVMVELAELMVDMVSHADWAIFCKNGTDINKEYLGSVMSSYSFFTKSVMR